MWFISRFFADDTAPKWKLVSFSLESEIGRAIRPPWPLAQFTEPPETLAPRGPICRACSNAAVPQAQLV
jgi:hypothetical protein